MHLKEKTSPIPVPYSSFFNYLPNKWVSTNCPNVSVMIVWEERPLGSWFLVSRCFSHFGRGWPLSITAAAIFGQTIHLDTNLSRKPIFKWCFYVVANPTPQDSTCKCSIFIFISAPHLQPETQAVDMGGIFILDNLAEKRQHRRYRVSTNGQV